VKPGQQIKQRLIPYRVLAYILYTPHAAWLEKVSPNVVRIKTADAARFLRLKNNILWDAFRWLETQELVVSVNKEARRGTALITLRPVDR
jgi:hypothetical protein